MKDLILGILYMLGFVFLVGTVGANEWGDISITEVIVRALITFSVLIIATFILSDDAREAVKEYWHEKKRLKTKSKRF